MLRIRGEIDQIAAEFNEHIELAHSMGRFNERTNEEHREGMLDWERTCIMGVGRNTLEHNGDVRCPRGHTPFFPCDRR